MDTFHHHFYHSFIYILLCVCVMQTELEMWDCPFEFDSSPLFLPLLVTSYLFLLSNKLHIIIITLSVLHTVTFTYYNHLSFQLKWL